MWKLHSFCPHSRKSIGKDGTDASVKPWKWGPGGQNKIDQFHFDNWSKIDMKNPEFRSGMKLRNAVLVWKTTNIIEITLFLMGFDDLTGQMSFVKIPSIAGWILCLQFIPEKSFLWMRLKSWLVILVTQLFDFPKKASDKVKTGPNNNTAHNTVLYTHTYRYTHSVLYTAMHTHIHSFIHTYQYTHKYQHTQTCSFIHTAIHTHIHGSIHRVTDKKLCWQVKSVVQPLIGLFLLPHFAIYLKSHGHTNTRRLVKMEARWDVTQWPLNTERNTTPVQLVREWTTDIFKSLSFKKKRISRT